MDDRRYAGLGLAVLLALVPLERAGAQQSARNLPPGAIREEVNPKVIPGLVRPVPVPTGRKGPLAPLADRLADDGFTFHALSIDFLTTNPTVGLQPGHAENTIYNILGVDLDLSRRTDLKGTSLHYETTIFAGNTNVDRFLSQVGDSGLGYQGTFNKRTAIISVATLEQKLFDDKLDVELGRTHPNRYYALPQCQSLDSCFQDILYFNAGFTSPQYSVWGANASYRITPSIYVQAGAFTTNDGARIGYDLGHERDTGALAIAELGRKTDFDTEAYPSRFAITGFVNTSDHSAYDAPAAFNSALTQVRSGTSGLVLQGQQIVWRADGGREKTMTPTALALYGSVGTGLDSTTPIQADVFGGATLQAPFAGRPADRFGVKVRWERLNQGYANYLAAANLVAGGSGAPFQRDKFVFETNAHIQLPAGAAFEPVVQYAVNPNSYYAPFSARRPRDGIFAAGVLIVPVGVLLGLSPS